MNRTLTIIGIWIVGSGVVLGHVTNDRAEECGWPVRVSNDALIASLAWPGLSWLWRQPSLTARAWRSSRARKVARNEPDVRSENRRPDRAGSARQTFTHLQCVKTASSQETTWLETYGIDV